MKFTNWQFRGTGGVSSLTLQVTPGFDSFGPGFRITGSGLTATAGQIKDAYVTYTATSTGPKITDIHLRFKDTVAGNARASVTEQAKNAGGTILGQADVNDGKFEDTVVLPAGQTSVNVNKDVAFLAFDGSVVINYVDQTFSSCKPTITCPQGRNLGCNPQDLPMCESVKAQVVVSTGCGTPTLDCVQQDSDEGCLHTRQFTITASNGCGRVSDSCVVTYTWKVDTQAPVISASGTPTNGVLGCNPTDAQIEAALGSATATDNCDQLTPTPTTGDVMVDGCNRSQTRTWNVTDICGNAAAPVSRTATWKVDVTKPTITTCPQGSDLGCNPQDLPSCESVKAQVVASDNCTQSPTLNCAVSQDGLVGCTYTREFTITATDECGNVSDPCIVTYTWKVDKTKPVITTCPAGGDLGCNPEAAAAALSDSGSETSAVQTGLPTCESVKAQVVAADNCGGQVTLSCQQSDTTNGCAHTRQFTITATDACGNVSDPCVVTYTWKVDTQAPVISASGTPTNGALGCNPTGAQIEAALGSATASDNCDQLTPTPTTGDVVVDGCNRSQTRTWNVTDICGNAAAPVSRTATWKVDVTPPSFAYCPGQIIDLGSNPANPPTCDDAKAAAGAVTDNCDGALTPTCEAGLITGDCQKTQTFHLTAVDRCGNPASCDVTFKWGSVSTPCSINGPETVCVSVCSVSYSGPGNSTKCGSNGCSYIWTIAGNGVIVSGATSQTVKVNPGNSGSFTLTLAVNCGGCISTCQKTVYIIPMPSCDITGSDKVCENSTGNKYYGAAGAASYSWRIGGNGMIVGPSNTQTVTVTAGNTGWFWCNTDWFILTLTVSNGAGCSSTCTKYVCLKSGPSVCISGDSSTCANTQDVLTGPAGMSSYLWTITGNGVIVGAKNKQSVTVQAAGSGSYTLKLTVTDAYGCGSATAQKCVTIKTGPSVPLCPPTCPPKCGSTGNKLSGPGGYASYCWTVKGTGWVITSGANSQCCTYTAGSGTGTFTLTVKDSCGGCPGTGQVSFCSKP